MYVFNHPYKMTQGEREYLCYTLYKPSSRTQYLLTVNVTDNTIARATCMYAKYAETHFPQTCMRDVKHNTPKWKELQQAINKHSN